MSAQEDPQAQYIFNKILTPDFISTFLFLSLGAQKLKILLRSIILCSLLLAKLKIFYA